MGNVYEGFWVNWEHGRTEGATLTLPTNAGLILVSFLTLFVQFSGACFWRNLCFVIHQFRSTPAPRDGLFQQQQIILRNSVTAPNALWSFGRISIAWRAAVKAPFRNSLPLILAAIIHIAFFGAAGLFSSRIASTTAGVGLIRSPKCGFVKELPNVRTINSAALPNPEQLLTFNAEILLGRLTLTKSAAYVRACYADPANSKSTDCNIFVTPHLVGVNSSTDREAPCPFGGNACLSSAVRFDSGHIKSGDDLGINYPRVEDLTFRRVTSCAPIDSEKYATEWVEDLPEAFGRKGNTSIKFYEFGKGDVGCRATPMGNQTNLTTFCVSQYQKDFWQQTYTVEASTAYQGNEVVSDFKPIADFQTPNADVTLISILNKANYIGKTDDSLFNAHNASGKSSQFLTATADLGVLGCTEQYQTCNVATKKCTELSGLYQVRNAVDRGDLELSPRQKASETVIWKSAWSMALQWALEILADNVLLAQDWVFTGQSTTSSALPAGQWKLEAENLHNLSLAVLQRRVHEFASPEQFQIRPNLSSIDQIELPTDPDLLHLCNQQKTRSADHYSLSVLGMSIILSVGSFLILLDWVLIQQIFWFRSVTHHRMAKQADWTATGMLQLHRQALEGRGVRDWDNRHYEAPRLVEKNKMFRGLAVQGHPHQVNSPNGETDYRSGTGGSVGSGGKYSAISNEVGVVYENQEANKKA